MRRILPSFTLFDAATSDGTQKPNQIAFMEHLSSTLFHFQTMELATIESGYVSVCVNVMMIFDTTNLF